MSNLRQPALPESLHTQNVFALFCYQGKKWIGVFAPASRAAIRVIRADEARMITGKVSRVLGLGRKKEM